jgi:hypothetical protein
MLFVVGERISFRSSLAVAGSLAARRCSAEAFGWIFTRPMHDRWRASSEVSGSWHLLSGVARPSDSLGLEDIDVQFRAMIGAGSAPPPELRATDYGSERSDYR